MSRHSHSPKVCAEAAVVASSLPETELHKLWIHCNRCFEQFAIKRHVFFLLACQHVSCEKCVKSCLGRTPSDALIYTCPVCHKSVRGRQVNNAMPNNLKRMFHPEPWNLALDHIEKFQQTNQKHFDKYKEKKEKELDKLDKDIQLAKSVCQQHFREQQMLRVERRKLAMRVRQIKLQMVKKKEAERFYISQRRRSKEDRQGSTLGSRASPSFRKPMPPPQSMQATIDAANRRQQITSFLQDSNNSFDL
ncbi:RING finger protein vilya [Drosophila madeirensis]|uniref:RING finger protein vilya n=1 Tax=Drosophila madeirensis TaxID=30013 RepID=A0AAU9FYP9_DROMD